MIYFHRVYRILPTYAFCLFFTWAILKYMGYGPQWIYADITILTFQCKRYWYSNLLFINNFVPHWEGNYCEGWTWYLANDMQFFIFAPLLLYIYHKYSRSLGWGIITSLIYMQMLCGFFIARHYGLVVAGTDPPGT